MDVAREQSAALTSSLPLAYISSHPFGGPRESHMKKLNLFFVGLLVLAASHCFGQNIRYNFDKSDDFSKFKTYKWVPIEGVKQSPGLTDQQIRDAFDASLPRD
jgi:hypothetical protein